jgi:hypothetical protein
MSRVERGGYGHDRNRKASATPVSCLPGAGGNPGSRSVFATPKYADPPVGIWTGKLDDGRTVTLTLTEDGGIRLDGVTSTPFLGTWTWTPLSVATGTLNCEPADWRDHPPAAFNVIWRGPMRIALSNPEFTVVLNRTI